jgi:hypothetical protein
MQQEPRALTIRIEGTDPPSRSCPGPDGVAIGIQRVKEVIDQVPSSTETPCFTATVNLVPGDAEPDFRGPFVHGPKGDRFLYLAWVGRRDGATIARIKLRLGEIDPALIRQAAAGGATLTGRLRLVRDDGRPVSGSVRPPAVTWSLDPAPS